MIANFISDKSFCKINRYLFNFKSARKMLISFKLARICFHNNQYGQSFQLIFLKQIQVSKCDFHRYGPSGTIEYYDVLCILPINVINEKIYIILWFWLIFLAAVSTAYIAFLLFVAMCPFIRVDILKSRLFAPVTRRVIVSAISSEKTSWLQELGDWLVLDMVFWNLDSTTNSEILKYITGDWSRESHRRTDSEFANQTRNASSSRAIYYARQKKESRHPRTSRRKNQAESENEKLNSYKNPEHSFLEETQSNRHCRVSTV